MNKILDKWDNYHLSGKMNQSLDTFSVIHVHHINQFTIYLTYVHKQTTPKRCSPSSIHAANKHNNPKKKTTSQTEYLAEQLREL